MNSFSNSLLADFGETPISCLSRPTIKPEGVALWLMIAFIDSLPAVPADRTSSIISTFPFGFAPIIFPPSPWSFSSFLLKQIG